MPSWPTSSSGDNNPWLEGGGYYSSSGEHLYQAVQEGKPRWIWDKAWNGEDEDRLIYCKCEVPAHRYVAFQGSMVGRRFLGCPFKDDGRCNFVHWMDGQWGVVLVRSLERLWWCVTEKEDEKENAVWECIGNLADAKCAMEEEKRMLIQRNEHAMIAMAADKEDLKKKVDNYEFFMRAVMMIVAAFVMVMADRYL